MVPYEDDFDGKRPGIGREGDATRVNYMAPRRIVADNAWIISENFFLRGSSRVPVWHPQLVQP